MSADIEGHCLCGAVTIRVAAVDAPKVGACHCRMCQRWSGGLFICFHAPPESVTIDGPVTRHASSSFAERAFCTACGSHLWMRDTKDGSGYDLMPGLFDDTADWPLYSEIYTDRAMASVRLSGDHRRATRERYEAKNPHIPGDMP